MLYKIVFSVFLIFSFVYADDPNAVKGKQLGKDFLKAFGTKKKFKDGIVTPLNSEKPLTALNGQEVNAQLGCPAKEDAIKITFNDAGSNEYNIVIEEDFNVDGTYDYTFDTSSVIGKSVSGVCEFGLVSCDKGTWNNCKFFRWIADSTGKINLESAVDTNQLGRCECSNSSCGMDLIQMGKQYIIAGAVSSVIMSKDGKFMLSDSSYNPSTKSISIAGQDLTQCTNYDDPSKVKSFENTPSKYFSENVDFPDATTEIAYENSQENSPYKIMQSLPSKYSDNRVFCEITKDFDVSVSDKTEYCPSFVYFGGKMWCIVQEEKSCFFNYQHFSYCSSWLSNVADTEVSGTFSGVIHPYQEVAVLFAMSAFHGDVSRWYKGNFTISGDFSISKSWDIDMMGETLGNYFYQIDRSSKLNKEITVNVDWYHRGHGEGKNNTYSPQYHWAYLLKGLTYKDINVGLTEVNTCPSDPKCKIMQEEVCNDKGVCVKTITNYNKLTINISPTCKTKTTIAGNFIVCADGSSIKVKNSDGTEKIIYTGENAWFKVKRIYDCGEEDNPPNVDFSKLTDAFNSSSYTSQNLNLKNLDGTYSSINVPEYINTECPNPICYVSSIPPDTTAYPDSTNKSQFPTGATTEEMAVRICNKNTDGTMSCPLEDGEVMVSPCTCDIEEDETGFSEAMSAIGVLEEATKDMICSSSPP